MISRRQLRWTQWSNKWKKSLGSSTVTTETSTTICSSSNNWCTPKCSKGPCTSRWMLMLKLRPSSHRFIHLCWLLRWSTVSTTCNTLCLRALSWMLVSSTGQWESLESHLWCSRGSRHFKSQFTGIVTFICSLLWRTLELAILDLVKVIRQGNILSNA